MKTARGFTLVEMIVVIVLIGIMGGTTVMYFKPAIQAYMAVGRRAGLSNQADTALRMMGNEIRSAVPNSLRLVNDKCFELVPTADGGRYRTGPNINWDTLHIANPSKYIDMSEAVLSFDVLTGFTTVPLPGDFVVIGNQNASDVYSQTNMGEIDSVGAPPSPQLGESRITLKTATSFPVGYDGGRFVIVPKAKQAVTYFCANAAPLDGDGTGTGTLYRYSAYGFNKDQVCQPPTASTAVVATKIASCQFTYSPNAGATQQSGYMQMQLTMTDQNESISLSYGVHVDNVP